MSGDVKSNARVAFKLLLSQLVLDDAPGATVMFFKNVYDLLMEGAESKDIYKKASMTPQGSIRHLKRLEKLDYIHKPNRTRWEMNPVGGLVRDRDLCSLMKGGNHVGYFA